MYKSKDIRYLIASIVFCIVAIPVAVIGINIGLNIFKTQTWEQTSCTIDHVALGSGKRHKKVAIQYHYTFNDKHYMGDRYDLADQTFSKSDIYDFMNAYQIGSVKSCYVNADNPSQSVINNSVDSHLSSRILNFVLLLLFFLGLSIHYFIAWYRGKKFMLPLAGYRNAISSPKQHKASQPE